MVQILLLALYVYGSESGLLQYNSLILEHDKTSIKPGQRSGQYFKGRTDVFKNCRPAMIKGTLTKPINLQHNKYSAKFRNTIYDIA